MNDGSVTHALPVGNKTVFRERASVRTVCDRTYCVAEVTEESKDAWIAFCDRHNIDRTVLCEVLGFELLAMGDRLPPSVQRAVDKAKDLKNQRRRRG